jgi:hypothetical protein
MTGRIFFCCLAGISACSLVFSSIVGAAISMDLQAVGSWLSFLIEGHLEQIKLHDCFAFEYGFLSI